MNFVVSNNSCPYSLPNSPLYLSKDIIEKMTNIKILREKEKQYDEFIDKKWQILLLLNKVEEILEIRDLIILRIVVLERKQRNKYFNLTIYNI